MSEINTDGFTTVDSLPDLESNERQDKFKDWLESNNLSGFDDVVAFVQSNQEVRSGNFRVGDLSYGRFDIQGSSPVTGFSWSDKRQVNVIGEEEMKMAIKNNLTNIGHGVVVAVPGFDVLGEDANQFAFLKFTKDQYAWVLKCLELEKSE